MPTLDVREYRSEIDSFIDYVYDGCGEGEHICLSRPTDKYWHNRVAGDLAGVKPDQWYTSISTIGGKDKDGKSAAQSGNMPRRTNSDLQRVYAIMLDDVGTKAKAPPVEPSWKMETSPGNYQWGYLINPVSVKEQGRYVKTCIKAVILAGYSDPGATGCGRLMRVPGSINAKPGNDGWRATVEYTDPFCERWRLEGLMVALGVDVPGSRPERPPKESRVDEDFVLATVKSALPHLKDEVEDYHDWIKVGMALKPFGDPGFEVWDDWSQHGLEYDQDACLEKWETFAEEPGKDEVTYKSILSVARDNGWAQTVDPTEEFENIEEEDEKESIDVWGDPAHLPTLQEEEKKAEESLQAKRLVYGDWYESNANLFLSEHEVIQTEGQAYGYQGKFWIKLQPKKIDSLVTQSTEGCGLTRKDKNDVAAEVKLKVLKDSFTPNPHMLAFRNGAISLKGWDRRTGVNPVLIPHDSKHNTSSLLDYQYLPDAQCPHWLSFLDEVFEGDQERIRLLQEWFGYCLVWDQRAQKIMVMTGESRSGKGVITKILREMVGTLAFGGVSLTGLVGDFGLDPIRSAKIAVIADAHSAPKNKIEFAKELLLNISSGDQIMVNRKGKDQMLMSLPARLMLVANRVPTFMDEYDALINRYLVLAFNVSFADRENPNLGGELRREMPGIFNWAVQGLTRLGSSGRTKFTTSRVGEAKKEEVRARQNPFGAFCSWCVDFGPDKKTTCQEMINAAARYCYSEDLKALDKIEIGTKLKAKGIERKRLQFDGLRQWYYVGASLRPDLELDDIEEFDAMY